MPLTAKGTKIRNAMRKQYGKEKGDEVFYASVNSGKITGTGHTTGGRRKSGGKRRKK